MSVKIPQKDDDAMERALEIADPENRYTWDYSWPPGTATPTELKSGDHWSLSYILKVAELSVEIIRNHEEFDERTEAELLDTHELKKAFLSMRSFSELAAGFFDAATTLAQFTSKERPPSTDDYATYFQKIEKPALVKHLEARPDDDDLIFAWQRIAGANPMIVRQVTRLPDHFPVTEAHFKRAIAGTDSLAAALAEGRALLADYAILDGVEGGINQGRQKYVSAPLALFVMDKAGGPSVARLRPVAIQVKQRPSAEDPIFTPADGWRWKMAKLAVQAADGTTHEGYYHLGQTHLVVGTALVAMANTMHPDHPIHRLLSQHGEFTLAINNSAKNSLIARGGIVDQVTGPSIDTVVAVVGQAVKDYVLPDMSPAKQLAGRGLLDTDALPEIPYRDDALAVWKPMRKFVEAYLRLYYTEDSEVAGDWELKDWFGEMSSHEGGRMSGLRPPNDIEELAEWVATLVFTATVQHAVVNFGQCPFMADCRNMPGALWAPPVNANTPNTKEAWAQSLAPWDVAVLTADTVFQLSSVRENYLADYSHLHFRDRHARKLAREFEKELEVVEKEIIQRDAQRLLTFPFLRPSLIPNSINI